ncbi:MAG: FAD-dependent oxidoreductase, partial [Hyphomicrobiales bacterium]
MTSPGTTTVDVVVFGAGAGGMTAALVCALHGLDVLLCEKSGQVGGTTATSAGTIWVPGTRQARDAGMNDTIADASRYLGAIIGAADDRREIYLNTAADAVEYLDRNTDVKFSIYAKHPDYLANCPGSTIAGRALAPLPFDGRLLGRDFKRLRPPIGEFMALGGMMISRDDIDPLTRPFASLASFKKAASLVWRHALDRLLYSRGTRLLMGNALAARLFYSLRRNNVPVWLSTSLHDLVTDGTGVCGAVAQVNGEPRGIVARRGVILATGGFGGSIERLNEHVRPGLAHALAFAGAEGDGMRTAAAVGAAIELDHESPVFWTPVSDTRWLEGGRGAYPHLALDRSKPGLIAVNAAGRRFVDEAVSYHDFVLAMHRSHETTPTIPAWLVCDRAFIEKYG